MKATNIVMTAAISTSHPNSWDLAVDYDADFEPGERKANAMFADWYQIVGDPTNTKFGAEGSLQSHSIPKHGTVHRHLLHQFPNPVPAVFGDLHEAILH